MISRRDLLMASLLAVPGIGIAAGPAFRRQDGDTGQVEAIRARILDLARIHSGYGDPDFSRQRSFEPLIAELLAVAPQPPVRERIALLAGAWKQVWGPYSYRGSSRGIDPELDIDHIYQVVFGGGYYYNVVPLVDRLDRKRQRIALLRGEYRFDSDQPDVLRVRFTQYPGLSTQRAADTALFELPGLVESGRLRPDTRIVPTWVVRTLFGGGALREVYTDESLRILYGASSPAFKDASLYIMERAGPA